MEEPDITVAQSEEAIVSKLTDLLQKISDEAITERSVFLIGISGGSMINYLKQSLQRITTSFSKWKIFFNDERVVPVDSDDSTFGACKKNIIGAVEGLTEESFFPIKQDAASIEEVAIDYILRLTKHFRPGVWPRFDVLLLGLGEDGHTCSLFPGHPLLTEKKYVVGAVKDSPKPPPERVTFTFLVLNSAANVVFVATGEGKSDIIKRVLVEKDETLPASLVQPKKGKMYWIMDEPAAKLLPHEFYK